MCLAHCSQDDIVISPFSPIGLGWGEYLCSGLSSATPCCVFEGLSVPSLGLYFPQRLAKMIRGTEDLPGTLMRSQACPLYSAPPHSVLCPPAVPTCPKPETWTVSCPPTWFYMRKLKNRQGSHVPKITLQRSEEAQPTPGLGL